jgi:hypothetical protein
MLIQSRPTLLCNDRLYNPPARRKIPITFRQRPQTMKVIGQQRPCINLKRHGRPNPLNALSQRGPNISVDQKRLTKMRVNSEEILDKKCRAGQPAKPRQPETLLTSPVAGGTRPTSAATSYAPPVHAVGLVNFVENQDGHDNVIYSRNIQGVLNGHDHLAVVLF